MDFIEKNLINVKFPTENIIEKELWNVSGIIKNKSNEEYKFDLRPITKQNNGCFGKKGTTLTKADKMVFEYKDKWVIVDIKELHKYIKLNKVNTVYIEDLIKTLEWNIIINK